MSSEVLQQLDLTKSPFGENLLAEDIGDFLYGHSVAGDVIGGLALCVCQRTSSFCRSKPLYQTMP